jgi:outer membrane lipoprotein-sorting protein
MSVGGADGASESYIYLPALDRVRRVAGGQEQDAFFGSDFSYEDITGLTGDIEGDFTYELLETRDGPSYVIAAVPTDAAGSSYERIVYEVDEALLLPTRIEFYRDGELFKVMTISQTTVQDGFRLPTEIRMETVTSGSFTTIVQTGFELDTEIPDDVFTERFLRQR